MPILPGHLYVSPKPSAFPGPIVGAPFTMSLWPGILTGALTTGQALFGVELPCDARLLRLSWAVQAARTGTNTFQLFKHTGVAGATGGTSVLGATSINAAAGGVEGTGFVSSAVRDFVKGQFAVIDAVIAAGQVFGAAGNNGVVTLTFVCTGYPLTDMSQI